jgi:hypothetical protein
MFQILKKIVGFFKSSTSSNSETPPKSAFSDSELNPEPSHHSLHSIKKDLDVKETDKKTIAEQKNQITHIRSLSEDSKTFVKYLQEVHRFNQEFGMNVKCDVCGKWGDEIELYSHRNQTYCQNHIPPVIQREIERKVMAGRHGASRDFIKK